MLQPSELQRWSLHRAASRRWSAAQGVLVCDLRVCVCEACTLGRCALQHSATNELQQANTLTALPLGTFTQNPQAAPLQVQSGAGTCCYSGLQRWLQMARLCSVYFVKPDQQVGAGVLLFLLCALAMRVY